MKKFSKISGTLSAILIIFTFIFLAIDAVKGPGSVAKHFLIDSRFFWAITLTWFLFFVSSKSRILNLILKINFVILIPLFLVYFLFDWIEVMHFPNYVLLVYKIHTDGLIALPFFSLSLVLVERVKKGLPKLSAYKLRDVFLLALTVLLLVYFTKNLASTLDNAFDRDFYFISHAKSSYDDKMYYWWGDYYETMSFIKNNTPEDATIIIPPGIEPWIARTGDAYLDRSFLYPRELIQYNDTTIPDLNSLKSGTFVLISWGMRDCYSPNCHGWPKQTIKAAKILYKDPNSDKVIETRENFVYQKDNYKYVYGLLEI